MNDQLLKENAARILAGLVANPNVVGHHPGCGWAPVNTSFTDLARLSVDIARDIECCANTKPAPAVVKTASE